MQGPWEHAWAFRERPTGGLSVSWTRALSGGGGACAVCQADGLAGTLATLWSAPWGRPQPRGSASPIPLPAWGACIRVAERGRRRRSDRLSLRQPGPAWAEALPGLHGSSASSAPPSAFACLSQGRIPKKHLAPQAAPHPLRLRGPSCGPEHPPARGRRRAAGVHLALGAGPPALRPPFTRNTGLISPLHSRAPVTPAAPASPRGAGSDTRS